MSETSFAHHSRALLLLLAATAISFMVSHDAAIGGLAAIGTLFLAFFKARLVVLDFMELRHAPRYWRLGFEGGLLLLTIVLAAIYLAGANGR